MHRIGLASLLIVALAIAPAAAAADGLRSLHDRLCETVASRHDSTRGGFVERGQVPVERAVELAFALARAGGDDAAVWRARAERTLAWTWSLYDSVGGGFVTSRDHANPSHPSFEKSAGPNARRLENFVDLWSLNRDPLTRRRAAAVVDYFERVLMDGRGGFMPGQFGDRWLIPDVNGVAIHAWLGWAAAAGDRRKLDFGGKSIDRVWKHAWDAEFGLMRKDDFDRIVSPPLLLDQVEMGRALILSARVAGRAGDLARAVTIGDMLLGRYEDPAKGGFYTKAVPDKKGGWKSAKRDLEENARAARFLGELARATGNVAYADAARRAVMAFERPLGNPSMAVAAEWAMAIRAIDGAPGPSAAHTGD